ncbi:MAG: SRPBCC family protein [Pseudomonadota bacterium]|nr:SRPBCC family protein [Pseudomonadota bacterium]
MSSRLFVALRVKASPERAFEAFTGEIGAWWRPNPIFAFTSRDPGALSFEPGEGGRLIETLPGGKVFEIGKISAWEPPHRLAFAWRQASFAEGQTTEVDIRFEAVGEETRVTVEHTGWDSVPAENVARHGFPDAAFLQRHAEWWRALLASFEDSLGGRGGRRS